MLKQLRNKKIAKRIFYLLAAIIIPAFVFWGSASVLNKDKTPQYAGLLFGKKVSFKEFRDAVVSWQVQLKLRYGDKSEQIEKLLDPHEAAWDRLILLHEAKRRGIRVKDEEVVAMVTALPFLQKKGRFNQETYDLFLQYSIQKQARDFEEQIRENLQMAKLFDEVTKEIAVTDVEIRAAYEEENAQVRVQYVSFLPKDFEGKIEISEEENRQYYEEHKEAFKVPPQINAQYLRSEFKEGTSEEKKTEARKRLKKAQSLARSQGLEKASKEYDLPLQETGLFAFEDPIPFLGWMPQLSNLLFSLETGEVSKVVETDRGLFIFFVKEKKETYLASFDEVREESLKALKKKMASELAKEEAEAFVKQVKETTVSFEEAAKKENLEIKETPAFSKTAYIPELGMAQPLKDAAFQLKTDSAVSDVIELKQGFFALKPIEIMPVDEEKFKEEKLAFSGQLLQRKRHDHFAKFFEDLKKEAHLISYIKGLLKQ